MCGFHVTMLNILGLNVAREKTATQGPDTFANQTPDRAVNGDTSYYNNGNCAHTTQGNTSDPAWWQVDLGETYQITGIRIHNRDRRGK